MIKNLFALMDEDRIVYTIGMYKGHVFRVYSDGRIEKANSQEQKLAIKFSKNMQIYQAKGEDVCM